MFGFFKKKTKLQVLQKKYETLLKESYQLSTKDRMASDQKSAEAGEILREIEALQEQNEK